LSALHSLGIDPSRLDWGGLLDNLERLDEEISRVRAQIKETRDETVKTKLKEELKKLEDEHKKVLNALFAWANAIEALKLALPREEWEEIYNSLPRKLRDFVDMARDPRDSFESFLERGGLKIMAMLDEEGRRAGNRLGVDEVKEAVDKLKIYVPMLDKLIEPVRAELIDALTERVNEVISELGNDQLVRATLELARDELGRGNLDNAVRQLRNAIENLRQVVREREELAMDVRRLDELVRQLEVINALMRLTRT